MGLRFRTNADQRTIDNLLEKNEQQADQIRTLEKELKIQDEANDILTAQNERLKKRGIEDMQDEIRQLRAQLEAVIDLFTYERDGVRYAGFYWDVMVTDELDAILKQDKPLQHCGSRPGQDF